MSKLVKSTLLLLFLACYAPTVAQQEWPLTYWRSSNHNHMSPMSGLKVMWDDADSKSEKRKIESIVAETLEKEFDVDMEAREAELKKVEERIAKLREQLDERRRSRDEVVELKVKEIVMDWKGLGWTSPGTKGQYRFNFASDEARTSTIGGLAKTASKKRKMDLGTAIGLYTRAMATKNDKLADIVKDKMPELGESASINSINSQLWETWESYSDKIDSKEFWKTLADFGNEAVDELEPEGQMLGLIQDTVAHLYYEAGDLKKALELQSKAKTNADGHSDIDAFFKKLKGAAKDKSIDWEFEEDDQEDEDDNEL